jgi:putative selenate reductase
MHGCKPEEILDIGTYLVTEKKIHTFIKLNPTLLGFDKVRDILDSLGYDNIILREEDFENDLKYNSAVDILSKLRKLGTEQGVEVGVKLTNTLPVVNVSKFPLPGESMYLSGAPLYPIAIGVAEKFAQSFRGDLHISFSGGIGKNNIASVLKTGIAPVTCSTILLKPRGFINMKDLLSQMKDRHFPLGKLDMDALRELAEQAKTDSNYKNTGDKRLLEDTLPTYDCFKVNCGICVDVCPNRANIKLFDESFQAPYQIIHIENRCYECGNCHTFCTRGGFPYFKKITMFPNLEEFKNSKNPGILKSDENKFRLRDETGREYEYICEPGKAAEGRKKIERIVGTMMRDDPYLMEEGNM